MWMYVGCKIKLIKYIRIMLGIIDALIDLFRRESPQERYARACYEAEMEEKRQEKEKQ